jgi:hypothetical protein
MPETVRENLEESAKGPKVIETDGLRVQEHDPAALIQVDKYLAKQANAGGSSLPIRLARLNPGSAVR